MTRVMFVAVALCSSVAVTATDAAAQGGRTSITLTGCVEEGLESGTYVVSSPRPVAVNGNGNGSYTPGSEAIYWLKSPKHVKDYVGQVVEIYGLLDDKPRSGRVINGYGEVAIVAQRTVRVPEGSPAASYATAGGVDVNRAVYKVNVRSVRPIGECR